jgi:molecular chaperone DnaK
MRSKIDYGIYLGTTHCMIARMENGVPTIIKTDCLKDAMPICVAFNKKQDVLVGDTAFNVMKLDNARALKTFEKGKANTFIEFVRTLGTTHTYESSNLNKTLSSEDLVAECIKKLKSFVQDENISSIVITVHAKFLNPQNEATIKSAKIAGFKQVELIQEHVAAAIASEFNSRIGDGYILIFDFGIGSFDVSLLKSEKGILATKDTEGDSWLGSRNIDEAIIDQIIIPNIQQNYTIDSILENADKKEVLRNAIRYFAEEAKKQMWYKDAHNIFSNLGDLPFEDDDGNEPEIDVLLTQQDLAWISRPIYQKAIDITIQLLVRNNLRGKDISSICLVGEETYSPILRGMLKEQISNRIDTSIDPMTVVVKGAALFASTISVSEEMKVTQNKTKLQLDIKYEATTVELDEMVNIKVLKEKTTGAFPAKIFVDVVRFDCTWSSGKKLIGEKATIVDVLLVEGLSNSFNIQVYDEQGNNLEAEPNQFSILQGISGLESMQTLPYHIGIGRFFHNEEKDLFMPVKGLEKNKKVPATGVINGFKSEIDIRPGMVNDVIKFPIYQGDCNAEGTNLLLNNYVCDFIISGQSLPAFLPKGSDIDITIKVDTSQIMTISAYFPHLNHVEELRIEIKAILPPTKEELSSEIAKALQVAITANALDIVEKLSTLQKMLEYEEMDADNKMRILDGLRKELLKLDGIRQKVIYTEEIDEIKGNLILFYSDNPAMGKDKFRQLLKELSRINTENVGQDEKVKIIEIVKNEIRKWS